MSNLRADEITQILELGRAEHSVREIAQIVRRDRKAIKECLIAAGIPTRPPTPPTSPEKIVEMRALLARGYTHSQIGAQFGMKGANVWRVLQRAALRDDAPTELRPTGKTKRAVDDRRARIESMGREGYRPDQIARALGIVEGTVRHQLHRANISTVESRIGKTRRARPDDLMDRFIEACAPAEIAIAAIEADWDQLSRLHFPRWEASLRRSSQALRRLADQMSREFPKEAQS